MTRSARIRPALTVTRPRLGRQIALARLDRVSRGRVGSGRTPHPTTGIVSLGQGTIADDRREGALAGAPSQTDTFDLKVGPWTPQDFKPATINGIDFPEGLMPGIASQLGRIAIVRSCLSSALVHSLLQTWTQIARSPTSATGTGWEPTPWHATQRASWEALNKTRSER
jgi:hypothetical protein